MNFATTSCKTLEEVKELKFWFIGKPKCITDLNGQILVYLEQLNNDDAIIQVTNAIDHYYNYTLKNLLHRSKSFWKGFIENFGIFRSHFQLFYTNNDMASLYNLNHLECVNNLIHNLRPLSDCINKFIKDNYENLYIKLSKLSLSPFVSRLFRIFLMISINYNIISKYH